VKKPHFLLARSATLYARDEALRDILLLFKHGRRIAVGRHLGRLMAERAMALFGLSGIDTIIPVPLHPSRKRERGFNQAYILAKVLSRRYDVPVLKGGLDRIRPTPPQTGKRRERIRNVRGAFQVRRPDRIHGRSILLVDDVFTTGATVNECAKVLMKAGAQVVWVYTLARAE
jgi:ComF family protein